MQPGLLCFHCLAPLCCMYSFLLLIVLSCSYLPNKTTSECAIIYDNFLLFFCFDRCAPVALRAELPSYTLLPPLSFLLPPCHWVLLGDAEPTGILYLLFTQPVCTAASYVGCVYSIRFFPPLVIDPVSRSGRPFSKDLPVAVYPIPQHYVRIEIVMPYTNRRHYPLSPICTLLPLSVVVRFLSS